MNSYSAEYYSLGDTERRLHLSLDRTKLEPRRYFLGKPCKDLEQALQRRGWVPGSAAEAHFLWVRSRELPCRLSPGVLVNHLVGAQSLTAKSLLLSCLRRCPQAATFFPRSFALPSEWAAFTRNFRLTQTAGGEVQSSIEGNGCVWILKPGRKSRGRGISLHRALTSIEAALRPGHSYVVQKYIERPLLIHGRKFDLRVWTVVLGEGLAVWIYDRCYARFSVQEYDPVDLENCYVHLTNNSVSKWATDFTKNSIPGCMWSWRQLRAHFAPGVWTAELWPQVCTVVQRTLCTAPLQPREGAFELLGFDFLVTEDLQVWLLEVNCSPSLQRSTAVTAHLVPRMLQDLLTLVLGEAPKHFHRLES